MNPATTAGDLMDANTPRGWLLGRRELALPHQQDGIPSLVEVKRSTDTRLRREVGGHMLDYTASALAYWPGENICAQFRARNRGFL